MSFCCCPFPLFYAPYKRRVPQPIPPSPLLNNGMQVQLIGTGNTTVLNNANVIFNTILTNLSPNIVYNNVTGVFTVLKAGVYIIDWWVNADGAEEETTIYFVIETSTGTSIGASSPSPVTTIQLKGEALVYLPENATFTLVNRTGAPVNYGTSQIQADLRVVKVNTI